MHSTETTRLRSRFAATRIPCTPSRLPPRMRTFRPTFTNGCKVKLTFCARIRSTASISSSVHPDAGAPHPHERSDSLGAQHHDALRALAIHANGRHSWEIREAERLACDRSTDESPCPAEERPPLLSLRVRRPLFFHGGAWSELQTIPQPRPWRAAENIPMAVECADAWLRPRESQWLVRRISVTAGTVVGRVLRIPGTIATDCPPRCDQVWRTVIEEALVAFNELQAFVTRILHVVLVQRPIQSFYTTHAQY